MSVVVILDLLKSRYQDQVAIVNIVNLSCVRSRNSAHQHIMSNILKRFISTASVTGKIYSGSNSKSKAVKAYLEQGGLQSWAEASPGLNEAGVETVEVV